MTSDTNGTMGFVDERAFTSFERELDASIDRVWDLIASADGLERWLAPATVDLRAGGSVDIDFGEDGLAGGAIIDLVPGSVLEYEWQFPGEPNSVIRFELSDLGDGRTRLSLTHRLLPTDQAPGYGAGWHAHLDHLDAVATDREPGDWMTRFNGLLPVYQRAVG